jgi:hypothetical protein
MARPAPVIRRGQFQGQILLERALFCVGCEIIFTGTPCCPRCTSAETVWPLSEWVRSVRLSPSAAPPENLLSMELYRQASGDSSRRHPGW